LEFTKKVGELAEEEGHHPALLTEWGDRVYEPYGRRISPVENYSELASG